jgi:hypothetical protein
MHVATQTAAVNRDVATIIEPEQTSPPANASGQGSQGGNSTASAAPGRTDGGLMASLRHAIASRGHRSLTSRSMRAWALGEMAAKP